MTKLTPEQLEKLREDELHQDLEDAYDGRAPRRRYRKRYTDHWRWLRWWCIIALAVCVYLTW